MVKSSKAKTGAKGFRTEELLKSYFLESGFFVLRGVSLEYGGVELTDIDIWTYERSASLARHRTIFDIKDKVRSQAAERLLFVKGVSSIIDVEAAGVVTRDSQPALREIAERQGVVWIGGDDLRRLKESKTLAAVDRLTEEDLHAEVKKLDRQRQGKPIGTALNSLRSSVATRLGVSSANIALDGFETFAIECVNSHPGSPAATALLRLVYHSAAIASISFDFASQAHILRPPKEREQLVSDGLRMGSDPRAYQEQVSFVENAIRSYSNDSEGLANTVRDGIKQSVMDIPAEPLAQIIVQFTKTNKMFDVARELNEAAYSPAIISFDELSVEARSALGAYLDFVGVDRVRLSGCLGELAPKLL